MSRGPEANFWSTIRKNLPEKCFATRIENKHGGGVPDLHAIWDGIAFWAELKTVKNNKPKIISLAPAVSVIISLGSKPVSCSNKPSKINIESLNVPGTTMP